MDEDTTKKKGERCDGVEEAMLCFSMMMMLHDEARSEFWCGAKMLRS
jgi:hypothetical protein